MNILVTNPEVDVLTRYLLAWTEQLIKQLEDKCKFYQLKRDRATREELEGFLRKKSIDLIFLNGHGTENSVSGEKGVLLDSKNAELLSGKIAHALSCSSAKKLGKIAVEKGAKAFVGYKESFIVSKMDDKTSKPLEDTTAQLFLDPAFKVQKELAMGKTPKESVESGRAAYARSITKAMTSPVQSDDDQFVGMLLWDMKNLVVIE